MTPVLERQEGMLRGVAVRTVAAFVLANVLLLYVSPSAASLAVVALIAAVAWMLPTRNLVPLTASLLVVTLTLELVVRSGGTGVTAYYRPHEVLALETSYRPDRTVDMAVPHGDLLAVNPALPASLGVPRHEVFRSDAFGYRNDIDYSGQSLILVGDSFLVGTDSTLARRLAGRGVDAYNVSFSGMGPLIYTEKVSWVRRTLQESTCVALFYFEGNDFQLTSAADLAAREAVPPGLLRAVRAYVRFVRGSSEWSRVFYGLWTRSLANVRQATGLRGVETQPRPDPTLVRSVNGNPMVFLKGYAEVVHRVEFDDHGFIAAQMAAARPDLVVFIPDKYRVYAPLLDQDAEDELPHAQWAYLKRAADAAGIVAVDLTSYLVARSRQIVDQGQTTFWSDDTHWNGNGEEVAAGVLLDALATHPAPACRVHAR